MKSAYRIMVGLPRLARVNLLGRRGAWACAALSLIVALLAPAACAEEAPELKSEQDKTSYAVGVQLGNRLRAQVAELDPAICIQGIQDALSGSQKLLNDQEITAIITRLSEDLKKKQLAARAEQMSLRKELAEKNQNQGQAFLEANKTKEGVVTLESGLQYKILRAGGGPRPSLQDTVVCHYWGTLIDGTEFDTSYQQKDPSTLALNTAIKGWKEALPLMPVGSKWQLFIPPTLAYGEKGAGRTVGPNATVVFEVELISIKNKS
jgi:FKBP-type peptidyl-prolyl cis-trans isomerase FklB